MASSSKKSASLLGKRNSVDDLETKPFCLRKLSEEKDTTEGFAEQKKGRAELLEIKFDQANLIKAKDAAVRPKTLFVANISPETEISVLISDIIDFFKHVGKAVRVQLFVSASGEHKCCGLVEFASSNEAKKALEKKNGEYLHDHKIFLHVATTAPQHLYCIDHKVVWYNEDDFKTNPILKKPKTGGFCGKKITFPDDDDYPQQERLPIEEDETPPDFVEEVLFVANLSPQTEIPHIIDFFKDIGNVQVRLTVNQECKHVGHGFVEFESSYEAKKALENKNGEYLHDHKIFLHVARTAPYPPRPKYNLADKLCYEDYLRRVSLLIEEDETIERLCKTPVFLEAVAVTKKTLYVLPFSRKTNISHIIDFFKDVGGVVNVRLNVNHMGDHGGYGYVEFASAYKAKKALQKKNGKYLRDRKIVLELAKMVPSKYFIDHRVWYEDYLRQESRLIKEDEAVEGLDETPGFVEEVDVTKRTLFVANLPHRRIISDTLSDRIRDIISCFHAGEVEEIVCVRVIVNRRGAHVGCAFVEFASADKANKVLQKKNAQKYNRKIFYDVVKTAPYPLRPKYNLAEKLWYEDYIRRFGEDYLETEAKIIPEKTDEFCCKKITFSYDE